MERGTTVLAWAVLAAMLLVGLAPMTALTAAAAITPVTEEQGSVNATWLGGGDHRFIRFGTDAAFGVLWGTAAYPNNIYLVAIKARYLGVADVKTAAGVEVAKDKTIRMYTVYALKLESIVEFNDVNSDGMANYTRNHDASGNYTGYNEVEPLYKYVSLHTAWTASAVARTNDTANGTRTWTFSLTARNLTYVPIGGSTGNGALDEVTFTFHLKTTTVHVDNETVPKYAITIERAPLRIGSVTRDGNVTWSGDRLRYTVKWDQKIVGWDFLPANAHPALVVEVGAIVANRIPTDIGDWFGAAVVARLREGGSVSWPQGSGTGTTDNTSAYLPPRPLGNNWINAGGNWSSIGRLSWVSNCTVDGVPKLMYAQVQGGIVLLVRTPNATYTGFAVLVGLSVPIGTLAGYDIEHDPTVSSDAFEITPSPTGGGGGPTGAGLLGILVVAVVFLIVVLLVVVLLVARTRKAQP